MHVAQITGQFSQTPLLLYFFAGHEPTQVFPFLTYPDAQVKQLLADVSQVAQEEMQASHLFVTVFPKNPAEQALQLLVVVS